MVGQKNETVAYIENGTPSLSVNDLINQAEKVVEKHRKVGKRSRMNSHGTPYWQPVKGIVRWEKRQHYYDSSGTRRTRVLETRHSKPRGLG